MKKISISGNVPESWKLSYQYDCLEIYGSKERLGYSYAYKNRRRKTLETIQRLVKPGDRILDLAAAQGNFTLALAELGYEMTWNDLRGELVDYVKQKQETGTVNYAVGNAFELNFDGAFDLVLVAEVIEHMAHPDEFLEKVASLVKPGGYVVMTTPNGGYFRNKLPRFSDFQDTSQFEAMQFQPDGNGHIFLLHRDEIEKLSRNTSLILKDIYFFTNPLTNGHLKLEVLLKILPEKIVEALDGFTSHLPSAIAINLNIHTLAVLQKGIAIQEDV